MHDIQAAMKPAVIPGEPLTLRLVKPGEQPGQGVGFLDDGTMVVAEDGGPYIGREVMLVVVSTLQTAAGRMVFARTARRDEESPSHHAAAPSHSHAPAAVVRAEVEENDNHQSDAHESTEPEAPGVPEAPVANAHDPASSSADDATPERAPGDLTPDHTSPDSPSPTPDAPRPQGPFPPKRPDPRRSGIRNPRR
jgi:hypothetical protein